MVQATSTTTTLTPLIKLIYQKNCSAKVSSNNQHICQLPTEDHVTIITQNVIPHEMLQKIEKKLNNKDRHIKLLF